MKQSCVQILGIVVFLKFKKRREIFTLMLLLINDEIVQRACQVSLNTLSRFISIASTNIREITKNNTIFK